MTANEAIKILEVAKAECEWNAPLDYQEAFDLAISALREQLTCNKLQQVATDTISRQAAIDAFGLSEKTRKYGGDHSGYDTRMLYEIQDVLEGLPSAQSELEDKIRAIGYTGKEGRIYIGGRLFVVSELPL